MQTKPSNWDTISALPHIVDPKLTIGSDVYGADKIVSLNTSGALYEDFGIGNCCARTMDVEFYPTNEPARQAACDVAVRLKSSVASWNKFSVVPSRTQITMSLVGRVSPAGKNYKLKGYSSCKLYDYPNGTSRYIGDGEQSELNFEDGDPTAANQISGFLAAFPYWYDGNGWSTYNPPIVNEACVQVIISGTNYRVVTRSINPSAGTFEGTVTSANNTAYPANGAKNSKYYVRTMSVGTATNYISKGKYFISKREKDHVKGTLKLQCYDAMLKAETPFTEVFPSSASFPMNPSTCVTTIANAIGVTLDSRNVINSSFLVGYPVDEDGDMTLREMLGRIAVANAGNWVISDANQLRLVPLSSSATPIDIGSDCASLEKGIVSDSIENVEILDNNGDIIQKYPASTVSGKTLYAANPDATYLATDMAQAVYNAVHGYVQYGFTANSAIIDPCAELGDRVTVGTTGDTLTSTIAQEAISFTYLYTSNICAPDADEVADEYPYATMEQKVKREVAGAYSAIKKTSESIEAIVQGIAKPYNESQTYHQYDVVFKDNKYWMCGVETASVPWVPSEWIEQSSGALSSIIKQTMDTITLGVSSAGNQTSVTINSNGVVVDAKSTTIQGAVTCDSLSASRLSAGTISATQGQSAINFKGNFEWKNDSNNTVASLGVVRSSNINFMKIATQTGTAAVHLAELDAQSEIVNAAVTLHGGVILSAANAKSRAYGTISDLQAITNPSVGQVFFVIT